MRKQNTFNPKFFYGFWYKKVDCKCCYFQEICWIKNKLMKTVKSYADFVYFLWIFKYKNFF